MRCKNCGWPNKPGATVCCKCKSPLDNEDTQLGDSVGEDSKPLSGAFAPGNTQQSEVDSEADTVLNSAVNQQIDDGLGKTVLETMDEPGVPGQRADEESPATRPEFFPNPHEEVRENPVPEPRSASCPEPRFPDECPQCHYPLRPNTQRCPNCQAVIWPIGSKNNEPVLPPTPQPGPQSSMYGAPVIFSDPASIGSTVMTSPHDVQKPAEPEFSGTVNPYIQAKPKAQFRLELIPGLGEVLREREHSFETEEGKEVKLNRSNTEATNNTITSKTQAVVKFDGEHWTIEDRSALQTTYVRAGRPIELHEGDIILLGDRQFVFHEI